MRHPSIIWKVLLAGLFGFPVVLFHGTFRLEEAPELNGFLAEDPLELDFSRIQEWLNSEEALPIRDSWGQHLGPSGHALKAGFSRNRDQITNLNEGLNNVYEGQLMRAKTHLDRYYADYKQGVPKTRKRRYKPTDVLPAGESGKILYTLYRYNRAVLLHTLAERNSNEAGGVAPLLRRALYDLRRSVAASEQLGEVGDINGTYWGKGAHAWEGYALDEAHGGLPISFIYTNLAITYLRLGDSEGYPYRTPVYLKREFNKYSWGEDAVLTPIVNDLIRATLSPEGGEISVRMFRLVMALHNMEAAGRGTEDNAAVHYYTVGLLLNHIADYPSSGVSLSQAADFFKLARETSSAKEAIHHMANKELALLDLRDGRPLAAAELLAAVDPGRLEETIRGPYAQMGMLFVDLAQTAAFSQGELSRVLGHLERRTREVKGEREVALFRKTVQLMGDSCFAALSRRLKQLPVSERAAVLYSLANDPLLSQLPDFQQRFYDQAYQSAKNDPRVKINLFLRDHPAFAGNLKIYIFASLVLWLAYLWWCYHSHRRLAHTLYSSGYGREVA